MKITISGDSAGLLQGIEALVDRFGYEITPDGELMFFLQRRAGGLRISRQGNRINITYDQKIHFFRAFSLVLEHIADKQFETVETPQFKTNGIMLDVSRGVVPQVSYIKTIISHMALMGLNMLMLYTEDLYEVEGEPYFGYMRGRYTYDELKACDDYADMFGIEIIPCIQTLGHMEQFLQWPAAKKYADTEKVLLADDEAVYGLIEKMIVTVSKPFRSRRIHVGMDEAKDIGLGKYLSLHGFRNRFDIMNNHVAMVVEIAKKYGLQPMMWSDMYFELTTKTGVFYESEDVDQAVVDQIPKDMEFVYWDYYNQDKKFYVDFIRKHKKIGRTPIFAGGIWNWTNFGTDYDKTLKTTLPALEACREEGVTEVFATIWTQCSESSFSNTLMGLQLYAECGYAKELDMEKLKGRTLFCTGVSYDDFYSLTKLYQIPGEEVDFAEPPNPSASLLWQDPMMGLYDAEMEGVEITKHYEECAKEYRRISEKSELHKTIFEVPAKLCEVLSVKGELGLRIKRAYDEKDVSALEKTAVEEIPELIVQVDCLRKLHRKYYMEVNKPFGFDKCDLPYGGVLVRLETAASRIKDYLNGTVEKLEELEEKRLPFDGTEPGKYALRWRKYDQIATPHIQKFWT